MSAPTIKRIIAWLPNLVLAVFFAFSLTFFIFHLAFRQRIVPGVYLPGVANLSGRTLPEAYAEILSKFSLYQSQMIVLDLGGQQFSQELDVLGVSLDATASAQKAFRVASSGNLGADLREEILSLGHGLPVEAVYRLDPDLWPKALAALMVSLKGQDARFDFDKKLYIVPESAGFRVEAVDLERKILAKVATLENPIRIDLTTLVPRLSAGLLESHLDEVEGYLAGRPALAFESRRWRPAEKEFLEFLDFSSEGKILVNPEKVKNFVQKVSAQINRPAKALSFSLEGNRVKNLVSGQEGLEVETEPSSQNFSAGLLTGKKEEVLLAVKKVKSKVAPNELNIEEILAEGFSNFTGSIPGRIKNIKRAAAQMNGILVPPGEVFSFNQNIGEI